MKPAIRLVLVSITLFSLWLFVAHPWWLPGGVSAQSAALDREFYVGLVVLGLLFLAGQLVLAWVVGRTPHNDSSRRSWRGDRGLEFAWTLVITAIFFWFHLSGGRLWSQMLRPTQPAEAVRVEVTGAQFQWYFRYPGPDGKFGRIDMQKFARASEGNPLGLDPGDPAGNDDIVASTLILPVGRDVDLTLRAQDVIHSVFIPAMRFKQDAVPGMDIHAHLQPTQTGTYEIVCSQLCGLGHYRMRAVVRVVTDEEFSLWLRTQSKTAAVP